MPTTTKKKLEQILEESVEQKTTNYELENEREKSEYETRKEVALKFVKFYFLILIIIIVGVPLYNYAVSRGEYSEALIIPLKDTILTYSAVVGPTVGLVVAYYFKSKS